MASPIKEFKTIGAIENDKGFVLIQFEIDKLKVKKSGPPPVCDNADITNVTFTDWGFRATVSGKEKGALKDMEYELRMNKLPYEIVGKESYFTARKDFVTANCKKKDSSQSWEHEINKDKLDTEPDQ